MRSSLGASRHLLCHHTLECSHVRLAVGSSFNKQRGQMLIGKINVILIGLIVVILLGLIAKEDASPSLNESTMRIQAQVSPEPALPETVKEESRPDVPATATTETSEKEHTQTSGTHAKSHAKVARTHDKTDEVVREERVTTSVMPPAHAHVSDAQSAHDSTTSESILGKEPSRKLIVFNIWSVSELRLRTAYAAYLNDSAVPATQLEVRKKEYLNFVSHRTKKCGELDSKFASNINTVEKLTISKSEAEILECHAAENNAQLDKLSV